LAQSETRGDYTMPMKLNSRHSGHRGDALFYDFSYFPCGAPLPAAANNQEQA
jgi:hypothetical protein